MSDKTPLPPQTPEQPWIALSLWQPWAWLLIRPDITDPAAREEARKLSLIKDVENRTWPTRVRGWVYVHASKKYDEEAAEMIPDEYGIQVPTKSEIDLGGIVGRMRIENCVTFSKSRWFSGPFGFVLGDSIPLPSRAPRIAGMVWLQPGDSTMKKVKAILSKAAQWFLYRRYETMNGNGQCPIYLERWTLANLLGVALYLHHFLGDDWAIDPHDHPRRFLSIGLKGWYYEDVYDRNSQLVATRRFEAPWVRSFPADHIHRVRASECGNTWTLVIVFWKSQPWGFFRDGIYYPFRDYVFGGKSRKAC